MNNLSVLFALFSVIFIVSVSGVFETRLFNADCHGNVLFNHGILKSQIDGSVFRNAYNAAGDRIKDRARCRCPSVTSEDVERHFLPGVASALNFMSHDADRSMDSCLVDNHFNSLTKIDPINLNFPETCTYARWVSEGKCSAKLVSGAIDEFELRVAIGKCEDAWAPKMSVHCRGDACASFLRPCQTDADCSASMTCEKLIGWEDNDEILDILHKIHIFDEEDGNPPCVSVPEIVDGLISYIYNQYTPGSFLSHNSNFSVCIPLERANGTSSGGGSKRSPDMSIESVMKHFVVPTESPLSRKLFAVDDNSTVDDPCPFCNMTFCAELEVCDTNETECMNRIHDYCATHSSDAGCCDDAVRCENGLCPHSNETCDNATAPMCPHCPGQPNIDNGYVWCYDTILGSPCFSSCKHGRNGSQLDLCSRYQWYP